MEPLYFIECLNFQDVTKFTGWQSRRVFYRHYLKDVPSLSGPVVAAGKVVHPDLLKIVYDRTFCDYQYFTVVLVLNFHIHFCFIYDIIGLYLFSSVLFFSLVIFHLVIYSVSCF